MTVYAVPQVLAATAPFGLVSVQTGTVVKLVRVLMLGPVVLALGAPPRPVRRGGRIGFARLVPWFILGFLAAMTLRSLELIPPRRSRRRPLGAGAFTLLAMAGLGLSVDVRGLLACGGRVLAAGLLSLLAIGLLGGGLARAGGLTDQACRRPHRQAIASARGERRSTGHGAAPAHSGVPRAGRKTPGSVALSTDPSWSSASSTSD